MPWFAQRFNFKVVVTVRHPAAFASSLKRLGWNFDFNDLLDQPLLMRDHLEPFRQQMQSIHADDVIGQASLLWAMIYRVVHASRERNPELIVVRHEDLSRDPAAGFRELYARLGLEYNSKIERGIVNSSSSENPTELKHGKTHSVKLDSRANIENWKKRLSEEEISRIQEITHDTIRLFYPDAH
jgi:hypothetical protein